MPIIEALKQGVRVIELDLWPSSTKDGGIKVVHGRYLLLLLLGHIMFHDCFLITLYLMVLILAGLLPLQLH